MAGDPCMEHMTLRLAAQRTARSVTTLRRYIRSGRLRAEKALGRYGPEYLISEDALGAAGIPAEPADTRGGPHADSALVPLEHALRDFVPASLYHELQMKHEQLLVQYGMVRAGGLRLLELRGELDVTKEALARYEGEIAALRERSSRETAVVRKKLRETELALEGRSLEVAALREKLRGLETIARRPAGPAALEGRFSEVAEQIRRVERLESRRSGESSDPPPWAPKPRPEEPEH